MSAQCKKTYEKLLRPKQGNQTCAQNSRTQSLPELFFNSSPWKSPIQPALEGDSNQYMSILFGYYVLIYITNHFKIEMTEYVILIHIVPGVSKVEIAEVSIELGYRDWYSCQCQCDQSQYGNRGQNGNRVPYGLYCQFISAGVLSEGYKRVPGIQWLKLQEKYSYNN